MNKEVEMFPYEIKPIGGNVGKELLECFHGEKVGFVEVGPKKWVLPFEYSLHAENYYNFEPRKDDVWVMTYPRSGTTWMQELLWLVNNDLDYETAAKIPLIERFPFFEFNMIFGEKFMNGVAELNGHDPEVLEEIKILRTPGYISAPNMKSPRHIKTHLPPSLVPPKLIDTCKVVYVARNPFDVAASFYHHNKLFLAHDFQGDFEKYWDLFEKDLLIYSPYWEHIKEGWEKRNHPNFLFLFYEDLLRDLPGNLKKISSFLNKSMNDEQIKRLTEHLQIDNFRKNVKITKDKKTKGYTNPNAQGFIRRGKIGGNEEYEEKIKARAKKWFEENLAKTDIKFPEFQI
ncbi:hypothetical protein O3M35_010337 [Rhynocoris fuscipes]|uniref:Sulfotransferase domain-containing protein n=1 Tax=Rhynocoris fuscipes TaxID=488301 RepID=A0AAW1CYV1_9HEMI